MTIFNDFENLDVIAPNFKRRLSGVTSTIIQLVPAQRAAGLNIAVVGEGLPDHLPHIRYRDLWRLWQRPKSGKVRVWHARRNVEMLSGVIARDVLRMPLKLVFTSAAQRVHKPFTRFLISRMDHVVATSAKSGSYLDVPHTVSQHGIDTNRFAPSPDKAAAKQAVGIDPKRKIIGCSGRIRPSKGTDLFVEAILVLLPAYPEWDVVIAGRATSQFADFKVGLEKRIADSGMEKRIRFVGEVDDILPFYQALDLFVAPSRHEGFGLTPLEAMACGVPCVTTDAGAYAEMIQTGQNGYCCAANNGAELEQAIQNALVTVRNGKLDATAIRNTVTETYALKNEVERLNELYARLMA